MSVKVVSRMLRGSCARLLPVAVALSIAIAGCASEAGDANVGEGSEAALTNDPAYGVDKRHSTMTAEVIATLKQALEQGHGDHHRFIKVGDSMTVSSDFLDCLGISTGRPPVTGEHAALEATVHSSTTARGTEARRPPSSRTGSKLSGTPSRVRKPQES